jgi:hypothetical protein
MPSSFKNLTINDTGYLQLPAGSSTQRLQPYTVVSFTTVGTTSWIAPTDCNSVEVLVVGGGGAGASSANAQSGGGGAGGLVYNPTFSVTPGNSYTVTVGSGGTPVSSANGGNGGNSVFSTITAYGGGGGGIRGVAAPGGNGTYGSGGGGGDSASAGSGAGTGGAGTTGQGNNGGTGNNVIAYGGGAGGGGAGSAGNAGGSNGNNYSGGAGGNGLQYAITGFPVWYAGGGGGSGNMGQGGTVQTGAGGLGGGGQAGTGASNPANIGSAGAANTGGGGGGGDNSGLGGGGGSGVVILRYKQVKTFTTVGTTTWTVPANVTSAEVLVVAGGGGGGYGNPDRGAGGGGGLVYTNYFLTTPGSTLNVTVGSGGAAGTSGSNVGSNGGNSLFGTGVNQLNNGTFGSTTGWTISGSGITINTGSNNVTYASPAHGTNLQRSDISFFAGKSYTLQFTISNYTSGSLTLYYNYNGTPVLVTSQTGSGNSNGTFVYSFLATSSGTGFTFQANSVTYGAANFTLSNVIIYDNSNTILAFGGGGGGLFGGNGSPGGSGGGGGGGDSQGSPSPGAGGAPILGQGFAGGSGGTTTLVGRNSGGGGGGAGGPGGNAEALIGGHGGPGMVSNITGSSIYYAGGGGGGGTTLAGAGGIGGGGAGGVGLAGTAGTSGTANTGGGGGSGATAGNGGSGIVIVSYVTNASIAQSAPGGMRVNTTTGALEINNGTDVNGVGSLTSGGFFFNNYYNKNNVSSISNLISYWPFTKESYSGGYFRDYGYGYHLRNVGPGYNANNGLGYIPGVKTIADPKFGSCIDWPREDNNSYLQSQSFKLITSNAVTVSWWGRVAPFTSAATGHNMWIISEGAVNSKWEIFFENPFLKWRSIAGGSDSMVPFYYDDGKWHHFVVTYNGNSNYMVQFYVDGQLNYSAPTIAAAFSGSYILVGQHSALSGNAVSYLYRGQMAQMRVFDKVLSQAEVTLLYQEF